MGLMLQGDRLVLGPDEHFMFACDVPHADGVDADLVGGTLSHAGPSQLIGKFRADRSDAFCDGECGAAGSIDLTVMMLLDDLDLGILHDGSRFLSKLDQQRDADGIVGGKEDGDALRSFLDRIFFFVGLTGSRNDGRDLISYSKSQKIVSQGMM